MADMPQVTWISYADIAQYEDRYESQQDPDRRSHRLAITQSIRTSSPCTVVRRNRSGREVEAPCSRPCLP
ncbi:MAG: hypothetical protein JWN04_3863 [Myxococcaceae bacterium]|nr:hypothetical protein [Myxococcaceae bacterium]